MSGRLTSGQLKMIAMGTMFIDHAAAAIIFGSGLNEMSPLVENIGIAMRLVGRMAFPLYVFLLVQGFLWTRDWSRYVTRMSVFALISEIPFNLMVAGEIWYSRAQNTIVTLLIGLICMKMLEAVSENKSGFGGKILGISLAVWTVAAAMFAAELLRTDYGALGVLLIVVLFTFRHRPSELVVAGCLATALIYGFNMEVLFAWIAFFFISRYNGERGRKLGLMPYVFYPVHLLVVWLVGAIIV
ncbi:MAG: conjugal transfer protein TraX [Lachnospiraceae bacterium]|nr:conjugal transfer protein TraX [Lachnospiraceae bacterium]